MEATRKEMNSFAFRFNWAIFTLCLKPNYAKWMCAAASGEVIRKFLGVFVYVSHLILLEIPGQSTQYKRLHCTQWHSLFWIRKQIWIYVPLECSFKRQFKWIGAFTIVNLLLKHTKSLESASGKPTKCKHTRTHYSSYVCWNWRRLWITCINVNVVFFCHYFNLHSTKRTSFHRWWLRKLSLGTISSSSSSSALNCKAKRHTHMHIVHKVVLYATFFVFVYQKRAHNGIV